MFLLILESLGSAELFFILVMALVFFGPRKLPQLSRSLGKGLAEFRKASEDFKTTWAREVNLEEFESAASPSSPTSPENSILSGKKQDQDSQRPVIEPVAPELVVPRESSGFAEVVSADEEEERVSEQPEPSRKSDWI